MDYFIPTSGNSGGAITSALDLVKLKGLTYVVKVTYAHVRKTYTRPKTVLSKRGFQGESEYAPI